MGDKFTKNLTRQIPFLRSKVKQLITLFAVLCIVKMKTDEIRAAIGGLPRDNPTKCEGLIRELNEQISALKDTSEKEKLLSELEAVAYLGLQEDLNSLMEKEGLQLEGLNLVVKHLTNVPDLATYLYQNSYKPEVLKKAGLEIVSRRLGPDIEVLGGLSAAGIDVSKEWVKNLCKKAPSLRALVRLGLDTLEDCCGEADEGEIDEVYGLVEFAESHMNQLAAIPQDDNLVKQNNKAKAIDGEKLKKAEGLMNEAKAMAKDQSEASRKIVNDKLAELMKTLELPSDWFTQDEVKPEQLLQQLNQIIEEFSNVVESAESYKSEVEIIAKASAGRALCGIYHSDYKAPQPAGRPLLQVPTVVTLTNPNSPQEINYMKFSAKGAAADYVRAVEASSTNIGSGVAGFYGLIVGDAQGGYGHEQNTLADQSVKTSTTSASVLQYIRAAKKTFQLQSEKMRLTLKARKMAMSVVQDKKPSEREKYARLFLERYGSHFPAGVQTLGGVFFSIVDAASKSNTDTQKLTEAAVEHLNSQISVGFLSGAFGIGASATGDHTDSTGRSDASHTESSTKSFTCSVKSMGPPAANPATFHKLLSYNSTWALIDRGCFQGYIPVWELIKDLGGDFEDSARVLEETWRKDESRRKEKFEASIKEQKDQQKAEEERQGTVRSSNTSLYAIQTSNVYQKGIA